MKIYRIAQSLDHVYTKQEMINAGADGSLPDAVFVYIPVNLITGKEPVPRNFVDKEGKEQEFTPGRKVEVPIEVEYDNGQFVLYGGNHRVKQAEVNGQQSIPAFVYCRNGDEYSKILMEYGL